eukprot:10535865-Ditylum_brightwellii.AAC.1
MMSETLNLLKSLSKNPAPLPAETAVAAPSRPPAQDANSLLSQYQSATSAKNKTEDDVDKEMYEMVRLDALEKMRKLRRG